METRRTGQILVASRRLLDPNFVRTVVLIVQQDESGVIGLILNRPLDITVAEACDPAAEAASDVREPLYQGGPCAGPLMVLHGKDTTDGERVVPGVRYATERGQIESLMRGHDGPIRYFAGYSGWTPQQLEGEIAEGAWLLSPANCEEVFSESPKMLWTRLTTQLTVGKWVDVERMPEDPSTN